MGAHESLRTTSSKITAGDEITANHVKGNG